MVTCGAGIHEPAGMGTTYFFIWDDEHEQLFSHFNGAGKIHVSCGCDVLFALCAVRYAPGNDKRQIKDNWHILNSDHYHSRPSYCKHLQHHCWTMQRQLQRHANCYYDYDLHAGCGAYTCLQGRFGCDLTPLLLVKSHHAPSNVCRASLFCAF
eukprot:353182-Chlamydomonas_euryale.AAC.66